VGGALLAAAAVLAWRDRERGAAAVAVLGALLVIAGALVPTRLGPVYRGWMRAGLALSTVTTPLLMALVYFAVLTPTALLMRVFGHRPLSRPLTEAGFWVRRPPGQRRSDLERLF
jgi:hypothetical protein